MWWPKPVFPALGGGAETEGSLGFTDQPVSPKYELQNNEALSQRRWTVSPKLTPGVLGLRTYVHKATDTCIHTQMNTAGPHQP